MRIAVTGANSAVGRCLLALGGGESFVACVRSERAEAQLPPLGSGCRCARVSYDEPERLVEAFAGCDALVHLPGVLIERPGSSYEEANVATTRAVLAAAQKAGVGKVVLVSAIGADAGSRNRYYRTKGEAEALVRDSGLAFTVLRAPLVLGPGSEGSAALLRHAGSGTARLPGGGRQLEQPLWIEDLARAIVAAAAPGRADGRVLDLVGPEVVRNHELVCRLADALGRTVSVRAVPVGVLRVLAGLRTRLLGPGFSPDALDVIVADTSLPSGAAAELGVALTGVAEMIERIAAAERA